MQYAPFRPACNVSLAGEQEVMFIIPLLASPSVITPRVSALSRARIPR